MFDAGLEDDINETEMIKNEDEVQAVKDVPDEEEVNKNNLENIIINKYENNKNYEIATAQWEKVEQFEQNINEKLIEEENKIIDYSPCKKNIDLNQNSSVQDSELMANIDKEAENITDNINKNDLHIYNKYDNISEDDLRKLIKEKK
jgi:hypothetical protein